MSEFDKKEQAVSALDFLNRPQAKKEVDKKKEQDKVEEIRQKGSFFARNAKWIMLGFANVVAITFDALAVWSVYKVTQNYLFSFLALLPTGVPMVMWEFGWMYPLASPSQKKKSISGIVMSVVSAVIVGLSAVGIEASIVFKIDIISYISFTVLFAWCVFAVVYHAVNAGKYFYEDPITEQEHSLQVVVSEQDFQAQALAHTDTILNAVSIAATKEKMMREQFGDAIVDRALGIVLGVDISKTPKSPKAPADK